MRCLGKSGIWAHVKHNKLGRHVKSADSLNALRLNHTSDTCEKTKVRMGIRRLLPSWCLGYLHPAYSWLDGGGKFFKRPYPYPKVKLIRDLILFLPHWLERHHAAKLVPTTQKLYRRHRYLVDSYNLAVSSIIMILHYRWRCFLVPISLALMSALALASVPTPVSMKLLVCGISPESVNPYVIETYSQADWVWVCLSFSKVSTG